MVIVFEDSVNKEKFKQYIDAVSLKYPTDEICFFFDNLSVHRSYEVRRHLEINNIPYIFCPAYSPDFNGIESVFSIYKNMLKRERMKALSNNKKIDLEEETLKIFKLISQDKISACIQFSLNNLFNH